MTRIDALAGALAVPATIVLTPWDAALALVVGFAAFVCVHRAAPLARRIRPSGRPSHRLRPVE
jgi:hypothetical protein